MNHIKLLSLYIFIWIHENSANGSWCVYQLIFQEIVLLQWFCLFWNKYVAWKALNGIKFWPILPVPFAAVRTTVQGYCSFLIALAWHHLKYQFSIIQLILNYKILGPISHADGMVSVNHTLIFSTYQWRNITFIIFNCENL